MSDPTETITPTHTRGVNPIRVRLADDATIIHHDAAGEPHQHTGGAIVELPGAMAMHYVVMGLATIDQ